MSLSKLFCKLLFQRRCTELEERQVQMKILLESSQSDKATISRVMQQNEKLKNEFEELQMQLARVVSQIIAPRF